MKCTTKETGTIDMNGKIIPIDKEENQVTPGQRGSLGGGRDAGRPSRCRSGCCCIMAGRVDMKGPRSVRIHRRAQARRCFRSRPAEVTLQVPKFRTLPFETALIKWYRRKEASVGKTLVEMYLAGFSVRRVEDITEALWGTRISPSTVSDPNREIYERIENWRNAPIIRSKENIPTYP